MLDDQGQILGAHRKTRPQERHAEPNAIVAALRRIQSDEAKKLLQKIEDAYDRKSWLESKKEETKFEELFAKSGAQLRKYFNVEKLHLYSSLEPCRDYETQPSCSEILSAFKVDEVIYGSDDLNEKGFGREVLERNNIPVYPNIDIQRATQINSLFFTSLHLSQKVFRDSEALLFERPFPYSIFKTDDMGLEAVIDPNGRMIHEVTEPKKLYIFSAAPFYNTDMISVSETDLEALFDATPDYTSVLQCGDLSITTIAKILADLARSSSAPSVPGIIATSMNPFNDLHSSDSETDLRQKISEWENKSNIKIFPNSFRKLNEFADARRAVFIGSLRRGEGNAIYALLKINYPDENNKTTYKHFFGKNEDIVNNMATLASELHTQNAKLSRLTLFYSTEASNEGIQLIKKLYDADNKSKKHQSIFATEMLKKTSLVVEIQSAPDNQERFTEIQRNLIALYTDLDISSRAQKPKYWERPKSVAVALKHYFDTIAGRDPRFFSAKPLQNLGTAHSWEDRKAAGDLITTQANLNKGALIRTVIEPLKKLVENEITDTNWPRACVLLNSLRSCRNSVTINEKDEVTSLLISISKELDRIIQKDPTIPWLTDVIWRWSASLFNHASNRQLQNIPCSFIKHISKDPFLLSECFQYWAQASNHDKNKQLKEFIEIFTPSLWKRDAAIALAIRTARLASSGIISWRQRHPNSTSTSVRKYLEAFKSQGCLEYYLSERKRAKTALKFGLFGLNSATDTVEMEWKNHELFPTFITLQMIAGSSGTSVFGILPAVKEERKREKKWSSDAHDICLNLLSDMPVRWRKNCLLSLCKDVDASLRLAGLRIVLNHKHTPDHFGIERSKSGQHLFARFREECIISALSMPKMYWIDRAVLEGMSELIHLTQSQDINDTTSADTILCPDLNHCKIAGILDSDKDRLHPELREPATKITKLSKKVLLILPPVEWPSDDQTIKNKSLDGTPPLGLGILATALSARGHQVSIIDAHRFSLPLESIVEKAKGYDVIGISVVISTISSSKELCVEIRKFCPKRTDTNEGVDIVLGGHAVSLLGHIFPKRRDLVFDALIAGPGEVALTSIVERPTNKPSTKSEHKNILWATKVGDNTIENPHFLSYQSMRPLLSTSADIFNKRWDKTPWIRRNLYNTPNGNRYEPCLTRDGKHVEAHILSSTGCNWKCNFCTEAIINYRKGEVRRSAEDVLNEIIFLVRNDNVNRIQFVDDNAFPSAPLANRKDYSRDWVTALFNGLIKLKAEQPEFTWRGLFRLEDLFMYEGMIPDFYKMMFQSGCSLIAVGIEYGNEKNRQKTKGTYGNSPELSNSQVSQILTQIRRNGIFTKAYFIIGGPGETIKTTQETIDFALNNDISIAYFAIYKAFRQMPKTSKDGNELPTFSVLDMSFLDAENLNLSDNDMLSYFGKKYNKRKLGEIYDAIEGLKEIGFNFKTLFKYNDYHDDTWNKVYRLNGNDDSEKYLQMVRRAYLEFFCRSSWISTYKNLVKSGY